MTIGTYDPQKILYINLSVKNTGNKSPSSFSQVKEVDVGMYLTNKKLFETYSWNENTEKILDEIDNLQEKLSSCFAQEQNQPNNSTEKKIEK